jgi:hypothetical protein
MIKRLIERFEAMAMAVAFAEAGEWTTAERMMDSKPQHHNKNIDKKNGKQNRQQPRIRVY